MLRCELPCARKLKIDPSLLVIEQSRGGLRAQRRARDSKDLGRQVRVFPDKFGLRLLTSTYPFQLLLPTNLHRDTAPAPEENRQVGKLRREDS